MTASENWYTPILRWKRGEWVALRDLEDEVRDQMTPLVEIPPKHFKFWDPSSGPLDKDLVGDTAQQLSDNWGEAPLFLDLGLLHPEIGLHGGRHPFALLTDLGDLLGLTVIPVTGLDRPTNYQQAVAGALKNSKAGLCLRLGRKDLKRATLSGDIRGLLRSFGLSPQRRTSTSWSIMLMSEVAPRNCGGCTTRSPISRPGER